MLIAKPGLELSTVAAMESWCHNINVYMYGYSPIKLLTGISCVLPKYTSANIQNFSDIDLYMARHLINYQNILMEQ